jgi:hypothetical protein
LLRQCAACVISLLGGIVHFRKWEDFYLEHRARGNALWKYHAAKDDNDKRVARIAFHRSAAKISQSQQAYKNWNAMQSGGLFIGLVYMGIHVAIAGFAVTSDEKAPTKCTATERATPEQKSSRSQKTTMI